MIPGPFRIVASTELSSPSTTITLSDFSTIPAGSKHLVILLNAGTTSGLNGVYMTINGDSGANYTYSSEYTQAPSTKTNFGASSQTVIVAPPYMTAGTNRFSGGIYIIPRYAETTYHKNVLFFGGDSEYSNQYVYGRWGNTSAVTSVTFTINSSTFVSGSVAHLAVIDETYKVASETLTSNGSITLSAAGTEDDLVFVTDGRSDRAYGYDVLEMQINGETSSGNDAATTNYRSIYFFGWNGSFYSAMHTGSGGWSRQTLGNTGDTLSAAGVSASTVGIIQRSTNGTKYPHMTTFGGWVDSSNQFTWKNTFFRQVVAAVTSVKFRSQNSTALASGFYAAIYKLPRNRILNHTLSSNTQPVGGDLSSTSMLALGGHLYGQVSVTSVNRAQVNHRINSDQSGFYGGGNYTSIFFYTFEGGAVTVEYMDGQPHSEVALEQPTQTMGSLYGGGPILMLSPAKARHKHWISASSSPTLFTVASGRWKSTDTVTNWKLDVDSWVGVFMSGTQFQVEGLELSPATPATSGFFFRFL